MSQVITPKTHAKISPEVFEGFLWTFVALTTCCLWARLGIKIKVFHALLWDDILVIIAWAIFITHCVLWKIYIPLMYKQYEVLQGKRPFDAVAIADYDQFLKLVVPQNILFYSSLWAVKFSFMAFFWQLVNKVRGHKIWWWVVLFFTFGSWVGCIADIQFDCTTTVSPIMWVLQNCGTLERIHWVNRTFYANCALDVIADILILTIPTAILFNTRVPLKKKIVLFSVFGATIGVMVISIIRVALVASENQNVEIIWLYFWSFVETGIAIMIANIASFRQLFVAGNENPEKLQNLKQRSFFWSLFSTTLLNRSRKSSTGNSSSGKSSQEFQKTDNSSTRNGSQEGILPLEFITVQHSYGVTQGDLEHGRV